MFSLPYFICTTLISLNIHKYTVYQINRSAIPLPSLQFFHHPLLSIKKEESNKLQKCYTRAQTHFLSLYFCSPELCKVPGKFSSLHVCIYCSLRLGYTFLPIWPNATTLLIPCISLRPVQHPPMTHFLLCPLILPSNTVHVIVISVLNSSIRL